MAYSIETADGIVIDNIPDTVSRDAPELKQRVARLRTQTGGQMALEGMSGLEKFRAGVGSVFADIGRGASQLVGMGPSAEEVAETRARDQPLASDPFGFGGRIAGGVTAAAPAMMIPGAATIPGAAAIGGMLGGLQPAETQLERAASIGIGGGLGAGGQWLGTRGAQILGERAATRELSREAAEPLAKALTAGRQAGYVVPPSQVRPTVPTRAIEGIAGKINVEQTTSTRNQAVTDRIARQDLGLPKGIPLTEKSVGDVRKVAGTIYDAYKNVKQPIKIDQQFRDQVDDLGRDYAVAAREFPELTRNEAIDTLKSAFISKPEMSPAAAIELTKKLRFDASKNYRAFDDPAKAALADAQKKVATAIEELFERNLGVPGAMEPFRNARTIIAKAHDYEAALTPQGHIDARALARALKGGKPMTGGSQQIAEFAGMFPKAMNIPERMGSPGVSKLANALNALYGAGGYAAFGPAGMLAAGIPWTLEKAILSGPGQAALARLPGRAMTVSPEQAALLGRSLLPGAYVGGR